MAFVVVAVPRNATTMVRGPHATSAFVSALRSQNTRRCVHSNSAMAPLMHGPGFSELPPSRLNTSSPMGTSSPATSEYWYTMQDHKSSFAAHSMLNIASCMRDGH